jgi:hypothetical protein
VRLAIVVLAAVLAGCASYKAGDYRHTDPDEQFARESAGCEMAGEQSRTSGGYGGLTGVASRSESYNRVFDACMRSKGYTRKP